MSRNAVLGGIGVAVAGGLVLGMLAKPDLGDERPAPRPMTPAAEEAAVTPLPVELATAQPTSASPPAGKLEVLPPAARAAPPPPPRRAAAPEIVLPAQPAAPAREPPAEPAAAEEADLADEPFEPLLEEEAAEFEDAPEG